MARIPIKIPKNENDNQAGTLWIDTDRNSPLFYMDGMFKAGNIPEGWVNVKDFGAKGDGVTDDTEAIQNALNTGYPVYIPPGTYYITNTLLLKAHLIGAHPSLSIIEMDKTIDKPIIKIDSSTGGRFKRIENLTLKYSDWNLSDQLPNQIGILIHTPTYHSVFRNIYITQMHTGLSCAGAGTNSALFSSIIENWRIEYAQYGLYLKTDSGGLTGNIISNIYFNNDEHVANTPIYIQGMDESSIHQINIEGVKISSDRGFLIQSCKNIYISSLHFEGNSFETTGSGYLLSVVDSSVVIDNFTAVYLHMNESLNNYDEQYVLRTIANSQVIIHSMCLINSNSTNQMRLIATENSSINKVFIHTINYDSSFNIFNWHQSNSDGTEPVILINNKYNYIMLNQINASTAPNNSIFIDSSDGLLKYKDNTGSIKTISTS